MIHTFDELVKISEEERIPQSDCGLGWYSNIYGKRLDENIKAGKCGALTKFCMSVAPLRKILLCRSFKRFMQNQKTGNIIGDVVKSDFLSHKAQYMDVYSLLSDEKSKLIFINLIAGKMLCDLNYVANVRSDKIQVNYNELVLQNDENELVGFIQPGESFVDCGAFIGDTLKELIEAQLIPERYFGFEPDKTNYKELQSVKEIFCEVKGNIWNAGVSNKNKIVNFTDDGIAASNNITKNNTGVTVQVMPLDEVIQEPVSLIKMDIEGAEYAALEGAASLIRQFNPKLAICIYHKNDDFRKIPLLIRKINANYTHYYIRHNSDNFAETILYVY